MWCVHNGVVCIMVFDPVRKEYKYIPENEYKEETTK